MKRGEIYFMNIDPTVGQEIRKTRPVVIVSNNANNKVSATITVIPITSNVTKVFPFEVFIAVSESGLPKDSKAQCQQIRTVSVQRIMSHKIGALKSATLEKINAGIRLHLSV